MQDKLRAMILGAFYGDAYALGAHWVYDTNSISESDLDLSRCNDPISAYHPTKKAGDFTHYGDQMLWLLESLEEQKMFSLVDFGEKWLAKMMDYTGYKDKASKHTLERLSEEKNFFNCGSSSADLAAVSRMFPIIFHYHNKIDEMQEAIKLHTIVTHMNRDLIQAANFFSEVTMAVLYGSDLQKSIENTAKHAEEHIQTWVKQALECLDNDTTESVKELGQACGVNGAFASTVHLLLTHQDDFMDALRANVLSGGDSAARGIIIGAILGILHPDAVESVKNQMNEIEKIEGLIERG